MGGSGLTLGKVIEIAGESGVGKSALVQDIIKEAQYHNLSCIYMDVERKFDHEWAVKRANVDLQDLLLFQPQNIEGIVPACLTFMEQGLANLIIVDSVSALNIPENMSLKDIINPLLSKLSESQTSLIFLSQVRADLKNGGLTTPYNEVLNDICNIRIMLKEVSGIKYNDILIGKNLEVNIYKNDLAQPKTCNIELFI